MSEPDWKLKRDTEETLKRVCRIESIIKLLCKRLLHVGKLETDMVLTLEEWRELEHLVLTDTR